jgi:hypothetical protein
MRLAGNARPPPPRASCVALLQPFRHGHDRRRAIWFLHWELLLSC